jgi:type I restriction enzyme S subunit
MAEWITTTVGEISTLIRGINYNKQQASKASQKNFKPILRANNIDKLLNYDDLVFVPENLIKPEQIIKQGDIIFAMSSGSKHLVGKSARAKFDYDGSYGAFCSLLRPCENVSKDFLYYFFQGNNFRRLISEVAKGSNINNLKREHIIDFEIPLPPLPEQHRIVAKIEALFSELDKGIESLKTAQQQLKIYRQALLKHAFSGKLTEQSENRREQKLDSFISFLTSGSRGWAQYYSDSGEIFIRAQNLKNDSLDLSEIAFVSLPNNTEGLRSRVQIGDLLITITGANITKSALVEHDIGTAYVSQHVALCRPTKDIFPKYLYWFVVAETAGRKQLIDATYGAGKPSLNLENIRSIVIPIPSYSEQQTIVNLIEENYQSQTNSNKPSQPHCNNLKCCGNPF